jgi:hypothetical protein
LEKDVADRISVGTIDDSKEFMLDKERLYHIRPDTPTVLFERWKVGSGKNKLGFSSKRYLSDVGLNWLVWH